MSGSTSNAGSSFAPRLGGALHTPTQSFSGDVAPTPDSTSAGRSVFDFKEQKLRDEYDHAKTRLSDQHFNMRDYPDPLLPRRELPSAFYPKGVTAEMEQKLLDVIARQKENSS
ncbi:hypothetical protein F5Y15DRAFT_384816 [Xylariaceae sp. FL0016]|nr:hypothetical protein F5Y15DRAFT_384816 [Xylariaceae sp. FL0016]